MTVACTPEEAAALVRPRDTIGFGLGPGNPDAFLTALGGRDDWEDLAFGGALLARFAPRIMTAQAAPPDADGRVNLSLHLGATRDELMNAGTDSDRVLLVEVNPRLPRTRSLPPRFDNSIPVELIDVRSRRTASLSRWKNRNRQSKTRRSPPTRWHL